MTRVSTLRSSPWKRVARRERQHDRVDRVPERLAPWPGHPPASLSGKADAYAGSTYSGSLASAAAISRARSAGVCLRPARLLRRSAGQVSSSSQRGHQVRANRAFTAFLHVVGRPMPPARARFRRAARRRAVRVRHAADTVADRLADGEPLRLGSATPDTARQCGGPRRFGVVTRSSSLEILEVRRGAGRTSTAWSSTYEAVTGAQARDHVRHGGTSCAVHHDVQAGLVVGDGEPAGEPLVVVLLPGTTRRSVRRRRTPEPGRASISRSSSADLGRVDQGHVVRVDVQRLCRPGCGRGGDARIRRNGGRRGSPRNEEDRCQEQQEDSSHRTPSWSCVTRWGRSSESAPNPVATIGLSSGSSVQ